MSSSGIAPQSTATNLPLLRSLVPCIDRATNSFPVPVSPVIKTAPLMRAAARILSNNFNIISVRPIMSEIAARLEKWSQGKMQ
jgi:hypothetical protein